jgi:alpha-tubulin suppressor-like RCC1 family protein
VIALPAAPRRYGLAGKHPSAALGISHSVSIDSDGHLLQYNGQHLEGACLPPLRFGSTRDVQFMAVSTSDYMSLGLSEIGVGDVYLWGSASEIPFLTGDYEFIINHEPQIVPGLHAIRVSKIAAGAWHCAALTDDGALYTWSGWEIGLTPNGLGYEIDGAHFTAMTPRRVQGAVNWVRLRCVAAGSDHTLVASQEGELFSFGGGSCGWPRESR